VWTGNDHVFALERAHAGERLLVLANFTAERQAVHGSLARDRGLALGPAAAEPDGRPLHMEGDFILLEPYQHLWVRG
jgi:amylosucrase